MTWTHWKGDFNDADDVRFLRAYHRSYHRSGRPGYPLALEPTEDDSEPCGMIARRRPERNTLVDLRPHNAGFLYGDLWRLIELVIYGLFMREFFTRDASLIGKIFKIR